MTTTDETIERELTLDGQLYLVEYTESELEDHLIEYARRAYSKGEIREEKMEETLERAMCHEFTEEDIRRAARFELETDNKEESDR